LAKTIDDYANTEFDLENDVLLKIGLVHKNSEESYLVFSTHHIIMDGWSLEVLINEVVENYQALIDGKELSKGVLKIQFKDYVVWYRKQQKHTVENNQRFWKKYLHRFSWSATIPFDHDFALERNAGAVCNSTYNSIKVSDLNQFTQAYKISLHTLLVSTFNLLIYKMYGQQDICVGTVNSGRALPVLQDQLGMFVKTLPLRTKVKSEQSIVGMLKDAHKNLLQVDHYQDIPQALQKDLRLDTLLVLQNPSYDLNHIELSEDLHLQAYPLNTLHSRLPLLMSFTVKDELLTCRIDYNVACYEGLTIEVFQLKYETLLAEIIANPNQLIKLINTEPEIKKPKTIEINFNF